MARITIDTSQSAAVEPALTPAKNWFMPDSYAEIKRVAKFVIASNPDTTPREAAHDLLTGKYNSQKAVDFDVKVVTDHAILIVRNAKRGAKEGRGN